MAFMRSLAVFAASSCVVAFSASRSPARDLTAFWATPYLAASSGDRPRAQDRLTATPARLQQSSAMIGR